MYVSKAIAIARSLKFVDFNFRDFLIKYLRQFE